MRVRAKARAPVVAALALAVLGLLPAGAPAAAPAPLGLAECGPSQGVHECSGPVPTWDGVPLDASVITPGPRPRARPLVVLMHGFGNSKWEYLNPEETAYTANAYVWAKRGYNVLAYSSRGLWGSCGTPEARLASPAACAAGYIHLADTRYEVRDAQHLIGRLVDEGWADPGAIGITGDSGGGGPSLALAALRDRTMLHDGSLVPWRSPGGRRLRLAAAAPVIPWSDLVSAAAPNGRISANGVTGRAAATEPVGVAKLTFINAIFAAGQFATGPGQPLGEPFVPGRPMGWFAPPGADSEADVARWVARTDAGEPYDDGLAKATVRTLARFHSAYYVAADRPPAPTLISSGFTDDLFPADEALRFANRTAKRWPNAPLSLLFGDLGHQRAANKPAERRHLIRAIRAWFGHYLKGGPRRRGRVVAYGQSCPRSRPSLGPWKARRFAGLARSAHTTSFDRPRQVSSASAITGALPQLDPVAGGGDGCVKLVNRTPAGASALRLKAAGERPLTLIGAPLIRARITIAGAPEGTAQLGARLWDVAPDGTTRRLVARGSYRPRDGANRWQLHPNGWRFGRGHAAVLELLGADAPFSRPSNGAFTVRLERIRVSLPVR